MKIAIKSNRYADCTCRTGTLVEISKATHWPVVALLEDGTRVCLELDDFDLVADVALVDVCQAEG